MKKSLFVLLFAILLSVSAAAAEETTITVIQYENYMCGDQFEISFPEVIVTSSMVSNASRVHANAEKDERMLQVRMKIRNMTSEVLCGMSKESFQLIGHVRDRSITYYPEVINNTDYFGSGNYYTYDNLPPLRMIDILLIYRVNPILINWELRFAPQVGGGSNYTLKTVSYEPMDWEPCQGLFQFPLIRTGETGELTRFVR